MTTAPGDSSHYTQPLTNSTATQSCSAREDKGVKHGRGLENWAETRQQEITYQEVQPAVIILVRIVSFAIAFLRRIGMFAKLPTFIGAGQAGLTAAGKRSRTRQLTEASSQSRASRHGLLPAPTVHSFPTAVARLYPQRQAGNLFEAYATLLELNVWTRTKLGDVKGGILQTAGLSRYSDKRKMAQ